MPITGARSISLPAVIHPTQLTLSTGAGARERVKKVTPGRTRALTCYGQGGAAVTSLVLSLGRSAGWIINNSYSRLLGELSR